MNNPNTIKRPRPGEGDTELFRMQEAFLKSKQEPSAKVINLRGQHKRTNDELGTGQDTTNKPSKYRSKFAERKAQAAQATQIKASTSAVLGDVLDPELPENFQEIKKERGPDPVQEIPTNIPSHLLTDILEKKPDSGTLKRLTENCQHPDVLFSKTGFPEVFELDSYDLPPNCTESLFYHAILKRRNMKPHLGERGTTSMEIDSQIKCPMDFQRSTNYATVEGSLSSEIHKENLEKLNKMGMEEILKQKTLLESTLNPDVLKFFQSRRKNTPKLISEPNFDSINSKPKAEAQKSQPNAAEMKENAEQSMDNEEKMDFKALCPEPPAPVTEIVEQVSKKGWIHMDEVESAKLEWMVPAPKNDEPEPEKSYDARFDFSGMLLPFQDETITVDKGLHHHGEESERPGYTLQELLYLCRSAAQQQRCTALTTLANILEKSRKGLYDKVLDPPPLSILSKRNIIIMLRFALDDSTVPVITAALQAMKSFLYSEADEICLDRLHGWDYLDGSNIIPELLAPKHDVEDTKTLKDHELAQLDCVEATMRSDIVLRIRYILNVMHPPPLGVVATFEILMRLARHSRSTALNIATTPGLLDVIVNNFIPLSAQRLVDPTTSSYGAPNVSGVRLCRILLEYAGRPVADRLHNLKIVHCLISYVTNDTGEAGLRLSIEALRLWRLLIQHGVARDSLDAASPMLASQLQLLLSNYGLGNSSELSCEYASALVVISSHQEALKPIISTLLLKWSTQLELISSVTWSNTKLVALTLKVLGNMSSFKIGWVRNTKIFNDICSTSNLLSGYSAASERDPSPLPSLGVITQDGQLQPAVSLNSCFPFLATVCDALLRARMLHELETILHGTDVIKYLRRLLSSDWSLQNSWYTRPELAFITVVVRSIGITDRNLINELLWKIAVKLISVLPSDAFEAIKEVLRLIFSNDRLAFYSLSNNLNALKLNNTGELSLNLPNNISTIYEEYISRENSWNQPSMPKDWVYLPLVACYTKQKNKIDWNNDDTINIIALLSLQLSMHELFQDLSPSLQFSRVILVYLCDTVYLNKTVSALISNVMNQLITKHYKKFDFSSELPGLTSFTDLYTALSESFCANSYGDDNFSMALLVPLAQYHNNHYRKMLWSEHAGALRYLKLSPEKLLIPLREFLYPLEEDTSLIENYITALVRHSIRKEWCPVLYIIAIHHSAMFLRSRSKLAMRIRAGISSIKDVNLAESLLNYVPSL